MEVHLPKPLHGWREFAGEVGIIVLGVLIALSAEQGVTWLHDRAAASEVRANIFDEAQFNFNFVHARMAQEPCISRRIQELQTILERAGYGRLHPVPDWVGRPDNVPIFSERWKAATASGRSNLFTLQEQNKLDDLFGNFEGLKQHGAAEQQAWLKLRLLERWSGPLSLEAKLVFGEALAQAKYEDSQIRHTSYWINRSAEDLSIRAHTQGLINSVCLPINTPANVALQKLARNRSRGDAAEAD